MEAVREQTERTKMKEMNGIIILICGFLLLMAIKLLIERNFIGLILFCVALFLVFGVTPHTKQ